MRTRLGVDLCHGAHRRVLSRAIELMLEQGVSHLLVVDDARRAVGVVSALDVAGVLASAQA